MVAGCKTDSQLLKKVAEIYEWLDLQISQNSNLAGKCDICGRCCNFAQPAPAAGKGFDHLLFITIPELIYLAANLGADKVKPMATSRCPYNIDGKCTIYAHRFAGCRIFCCRGDSDFQSKLSESAIKKLKSICRDLQIPYRYSDLATALSTFTEI